MNIINKKDGNKEVVEFVANYLLSGKIIAYPTETVYGLGCDATNIRATKKINKLKGSEEKKQLLILVSDMKMANEFAVFNQAGLSLTKKYWPSVKNKTLESKGALTLILPTTEIGKKIFKTKTIGLRISSNELAMSLVKKLGRPLVSTSANLIGGVPAQSGQQVMDSFADHDLQPDLILDAGKLNKSKGSTIVDCTTENFKIIRQGDLKI